MSAPAAPKPSLVALLAAALAFLAEERRVGTYAYAGPVDERQTHLFWVHPTVPLRKPADHPKHIAFGMWEALAWELSMLLGGQWWPGFSSITWVYGPYKVYLVFPHRKREIEDARVITHEVTGRSGLPYSVAGCARALLDYVNVKDAASKAGDFLLRDIQWHYQMCTPKSAPKARLYDVKACYATLLSRMPSPLVSFFGEGEVSFTPLPKSARERWQRVCAAMYEHKGLRNSFVGNMTGRLSDGREMAYYCQGQRRLAPKFLAPLRPGGLLVVRTAYELCAEAVEESRALYAATDCVITETGHEAPRAWTRHGLKVELRAVGESDIRAVGVYRVGLPDHKGPCTLACKDKHHKQTKWYESGAAAGNPGTPRPALAVTVQGPHWGQWLDSIRMKKEVA